MVFLPTFLKKGEHHQFLNHVFWGNSRNRIRPSGVLSDKTPKSKVWKNPEKTLNETQDQKWDGGWVQNWRWRRRRIWKSKSNFDKLKNNGWSSQNLFHLEENQE